MPNPAVAWIPLGIEPFGRVAHPAHGEGSHRHAMAGDDHMADVVSPVVVDDGAKHVFTPDRNVETAFSHWGCGILSDGILVTLDQYFSDHTFDAFQTFSEAIGQVRHWLQAVVVPLVPQGTRNSVFGAVIADRVSGIWTSIHN
jgi:hypothetical protein